MSTSPNKKPMPKAVWALIALAALTAGGIAGGMFASKASPETKTITLLQSPRPITDFQMLDQEGRAADASFLKGRWSLLFAGFTSCPNICPTTLSLLKRVNDSLDTEQKPRVVLLTVDPERDHPQQLKKYLSQFDPQFVGLTGETAAIASLRTQLGLIAEKVTGPSGDYTMDHSAALVLINPQGRIAGYLSPPFDAAAIADDLRQLVGTSG